MATVQILRNGQITLPVELRRALKLERGEFLDVRLQGKKVVLTPQTLTTEEEIRKKVSEVVEGIRNKNKNFSAKEIEKDVAKALKATRIPKSRVKC
jgi:AbrB family looped-hinge helix DNA binding protein